MAREPDLARTNQSSFAGLTSFLLPEREVCLKIVFDNIRNMLISLTVFLAGVWAQNHGIPYMVPRAAMWFATPILLIGAGLYILNSLQTLLIVSRAVDQFRWRGVGILVPIVQLAVLLVLLALYMFGGIILLAAAGHRVGEF